MTVLCLIQASVKYTMKFIYTNMVGWCRVIKALRSITKTLTQWFFQFSNTTDFEDYEWNLSEIVINRIVEIVKNNRNGPQVSLKWLLEYARSKRLKQYLVFFSLKSYVTKKVYSTLTPFQKATWFLISIAASLGET